MQRDLIYKIAKNEFILGDESLHGEEHWSRVEKIGIYLSELTGADVDVVRIFAYLHDCKRENEMEDPGHGERAAELVKKLSAEGVLQLGEKSLSELIYACYHHNKKSKSSENINILTCWDSDALDLWRIDIVPDPNWLNTKEARSRKLISFSYKLFEKYKK
ncbi:HD domain-containing protein [Candidatus Woesebacteria bacterium]|nr:HD domain-containing protein [Candidatus Woesebacteria bacterium]